MGGKKHTSKIAKHMTADVCDINHLTRLILARCTVNFIL